MLVTIAARAATMTIVNSLRRSVPCPWPVDLVGDSSGDAGGAGLT